MVESHAATWMALLQYPRIHFMLGHIQISYMEHPVAPVLDSSMVFKKYSRLIPLVGIWMNSSIWNPVSRLDWSLAASNIAPQLTCSISTIRAESVPH